MRATEEATLAGLEAQNAALLRSIRERDLAEANAKADQIAKDTATANAKDAAARAEALVAEVEQVRTGSWLAYQFARLESEGRIREADYSDLVRSIPERGWPPGKDPSDFNFAGAPSGGYVEAEETTMAKTLREKWGVKL